MEFGYFTLSDNHYENNPRDANQFVSDIAAEALYADQLGMHSAWIGEHHFNSLGVLSCPDLVLAYIAARTKHIRLAPAVHVTPLHNPIRVAEQWATLDLLSGGRVDFAAGRGYDAANTRRLLLELQVRRLHDIGEHLDVAVDPRAEFLGRAAFREIGDAANALADAGVGHRLAQRRLELLGDRRRRAGDEKRADPLRLEVDVAEPRLRQASACRQFGDAALPCQPQARAPCRPGPSAARSPESGKTNSVWPPTTLSVISLVERYGIGCPGIPVFSLNSSDAMVKAGDEVG